MTIVEKVISLLQVNKTMSLSEIYDSLPEYKKSSIRGNINRYLINTEENAAFSRIDKGVYSVVEVVKVTELSDEDKSVNYVATYYNGNKEISFIHRDYVTKEDVKTGVYQRMDNFSSFEDMENHYESLSAMLIQDDAREILKRLKTESFDMILTDVPYRTISGGACGEGDPSGMLTKNNGKIFEHNNISFSEYMGELFRVLKNECHAYFFINLLNLQELMAEVQKAGFQIHNLLVWKKNNATPNRWYMKNAEYVLFCRKGKAKSIADKGCKTVHEFNNIIGNKIHETEKPVDLLRMYIRNSTKEGDMILDPFAGSGSSLIAAMCENRKCTTIEIDGSYISKIKERVRFFLENGVDFREVGTCLSFTS